MLSAVVIALLLQASPTQRARVQWVHNPRTANSTWVSDQWRHLRPTTVDSANAIIASLERETGAEIAVVVVDSTSGLEAQEFATALHRTWGVGKTGRDNGVVLLWDPVYRAIFISVGYGLEGAIPDRRAGRIRDEIIAEFRQQRFDEGILAGVRSIAAAAREDSGGTRSGITPRMIEEGGPRSLRTSDEGGGAGPLPWILGGLATLASGIGGLVGWKRWQRKRPRACSNGHQMRLLDERKDDDHLDQGAKAEERAGSIDWDVWVCRECKEVLRIPYKKLFTQYHACPECKRLTAISVTKTIVAATTLHGGRERVIDTCSNCGWKKETEHATPRIVPSSSSSSSSGGHSGSSGGGGGGSFGGGSAGGGGAGGRY